MPPNAARAALEGFPGRLTRKNRNHAVRSLAGTVVPIELNHPPMPSCLSTGTMMLLWSNVNTCIDHCVAAPVGLEFTDSRRGKVPGGHGSIDRR